MKALVLFLFALIPTTFFQDSANEVLQKSIAYHDPRNQWSELEATFHFVETRPGDSNRNTIFTLNNGLGKWKLNRNDEEVYEVIGEDVSVLKGDREESRGLILRNYYLYLWGLPMKLMDESTPEITVSDDEEINGINSDVLRVAYEADTWYFYVDKETGKLLEYRFYKDEDNGKGELIKLEEEVSFSGLKFPKKRSWYTLPEMEYLGTDILDRVE